MAQVTLTPTTSAADAEPDGALVMPKSKLQELELDWLQRSAERLGCIGMDGNWYMKALVELRDSGLLFADFDQQRYKDRVRRVALAGQRSEGWCDEGLNGALKQLGIPPVTRYYAAEGEAILIVAQSEEQWPTAFDRLRDRVERWLSQNTTVDAEDPVMTLSKYGRMETTTRYLVEMPDGSVLHQEVKSGEEHCAVMLSFGIKSLYVDRHSTPESTIVTWIRTAIRNSHWTVMEASLKVGSLKPITGEVPMKELDDDDEDDE
jgi:hypothetical protein